MTIAAVKLADLIERGRESTGPTTPAEPRYRPPVARDHNASFHKPGLDLAHSVAANIEILALQLYSLSRSREQSPGELMRDALRSIESCLESIKRHH